MSVIYSLIVLGWIFFNPARPQDKQSEFCSSRTTEAYHSPKCGWGWVVHDPHRVEDVSIPHKPSYHTYSRWTLNSSTYIFAYRDIEEQPEDMTVDIYLVNESTGFERVGTVRIPGVVTNVSTARLTAGAVPDVVFHLESGELMWLDVVRIFGRKANQVFWYGASQIDVSIDPKPTILAKSRLANTVEQFAWDPKSSNFVRIRQYTWQKTQ